VLLVGHHTEPDREGMVISRIDVDNAEASGIDICLVTRLQKDRVEGHCHSIVLYRGLTLALNSLIVSGSGCWAFQGLRRWSIPRSSTLVTS
jgi:hypothetical protein